MLSTVRYNPPNTTHISFSPEESEKGTNVKNQNVVILMFSEKFSKTKP